MSQRRRSVVKYMRSGSVRSSHQTVSVYTLRQWFPNTQQSRFLTACMRLEKLVLPSIFDTKSFIIHDVKLAELSNNGFEWKNVTFFGGQKLKTSDPRTKYFYGSRSSDPPRSGPSMHVMRGRPLSNSEGKTIFFEAPETVWRLNLTDPDPPIFYDRSMPTDLCSRNFSQYLGHRCLRHRNVYIEQARFQSNCNSVYTDAGHETRVHSRYALMNLIVIQSLSRWYRNRIRPLRIRQQIQTELAPTSRSVRWSYRSEMGGTADPLACRLKSAEFIGSALNDGGSLVDESLRTQTGADPVSCSVFFFW